MSTLSFSAGTTHNFKFSITYSSDWSVSAKQGTNVLQSDVKGATFLIKDDPQNADADALVTKTVSGGGITITDGEALVQVDADDINELEGEYYATLRLFLSGGSVQDFLYNGSPNIAITAEKGCVISIA